MMKTIKYKNKQKGVALVIGMILLLIISVIGITSMKSALLQEKMSAGLKNREIADAAAMSLLVSVEEWLFDYYLDGNGVELDGGHSWILNPNNSIDLQYGKGFRTERNFVSGFRLGSDTINSEFGSILADEPMFIIEVLESGGGVVTAEFDDGASGGSGGSGADDGSQGSNKMLIYKIVSKASDTTGYLISAFESVMSVKVR